MNRISPRTLCRLVLFFLSVAAALRAEAPDPAWEALHHDHEGKEESVPIPYAMGEPAECKRGRADVFYCKNVDLLGHVDLSVPGAMKGNDVWGWYDARTGREYALMGHSAGTTFVDVTDPRAPIVVGTLPTQTLETTWRDIKVYGNWAYVVADGAEQHGVQVFNLKRLRRAVPPQLFTPNRVYDGLGSSHNIAINEETGFAYAVGSDTCEGGLHMIDLRRPSRPTFAGCFSEDGYTHDAQCVVYRGPDEEYFGREICFAANEDTLTVVDVTDKSAPRLVSRPTYDGVGYAHQGWLTEDHAWFFLDDEADEAFNETNTRTLVWDVSDLERPFVTGAHFSNKPSIDHNQYVRGDLLFQSNYSRGLQVLRILDPASARLREVARFDSHPEHNLPNFEGSWSVYPYLPSGTLLLNDRNRGLFVLGLRLR